MKRLFPAMCTLNGYGVNLKSCMANRNGLKNPVSTLTNYLLISTDMFIISLVQKNRQATMMMKRSLPTCMAQPRNAGWVDCSPIPLMSPGFVTPTTLLHPRFNLCASSFVNLIYGSSIETNMSFIFTPVAPFFLCSLQCSEFSSIPRHL